MCGATRVVSPLFKFMTLSLSPKKDLRTELKQNTAISARVLMTLFLATLMGLMFEDVGRWSPEDLSDGLRMSEKLSNHFGAVTLISSALMMATTQPVRSSIHTRL